VQDIVYIDRGTQTDPPPPTRSSAVARLTPHQLTAALHLERDARAQLERRLSALEGEKALRVWSAWREGEEAEARCVELERRLAEVEDRNRQLEARAAGTAL
jgi:hypothetical protein